MANVKITELTELAAVDLADTDVLPIVDVGADTTKKITAASIRQTLAYANDYVTYVQLNSNIDIVSANADAYNVQLNANLDAVQSNVDSQNTYIASTYATLTLLDSVQDNVGSAESNVSAVESRRASNTFYDYTTNFNVVVTANVEPQQNNVFSLGAPDLVWKDIYLGPGTLYLGDLTIQPSADATGIIITGADATSTIIDTSVANVTANLNVLQDNVAAAEANVVSAETRLNANLDIIQDNVTAIVDATAVETRLNANLDVTNDNVTTLTTTVDNFGSYANNTFDTKANVSATLFLARANDFATYTLINANLDIVQDNVTTLTTTVDSFGTYANTNLDTKANVSATFIQLDANISVVQDNVTTLTTTVDNFGTSSNANAAALALEDVALQTRLGANVTSLQNEDTALQARIAANALVAASNDYVTYTRLDANVSAVQDNVAAAEANIAAIIDGSTAFTGDVTMNQALTVSGNLYVVGAQVDLGISSAQIDDATLLLAANTPSDAQLGVDSGIVINRGQDANVFFGFAQYGDHIDFIFTDAPGDNVVHYPIAYIDVHANTFGTEATTTAAFTAFHDTDAVNTGIYWPESNIGFSVGGVNKANIYSGGISAHGVYSQGVELRANDYATYTILNANLDVIQDNVASITTRSDAFGTYANSTFSTVSNAGSLATAIATKLDSASYTASDVLTKIKTVDGAGSGLDADLLDGQTSTYFAVEATRSSNAAALAAGIAGITPIGTSDISDGAVTVGKLAATLDLGALS